MKRKSVHEPQAKVMSAEDVWDDAQQIATVLKQNLLKAEPVVQLYIPLSSFLLDMENLNQDELVVLHKCIEERLAA